ncbi:MAG: nitroreductase family protein [Patescibacteria group bacterium]
MSPNKRLLKELKDRKSVRAFADKEIEPEKLEALWEAAGWAPSSRNLQEWHYYAATGNARGKFKDVLMEGNEWALKAPLLIGVTRDTSIENSVQTREYGAYDVALSVMSLVIEAEHQGLRTHQMGGFDENVFRNNLNIPENEKPAVVIAVGYEGDIDDLDGIALEKEKKPRERKSIDEMVTMLK